MITEPLTALLRKNSFNWSNAATLAFNALKIAVTNAPVLVLPNFTLPFEVKTDALGFGVGVVLMQKRCPIAFFNKALHGKHLLLPTYEEEMLALILAIEKWRHYLMGNHFVVRTDHCSLKYLWEQKLTTTTQHKWLIKLMGYNFYIEYKKGVENCVTDALSRKPSCALLEPLVNSFGKVTYHFTALVPQWLETIKEEVHTCEQLLDVIRKIRNGELVASKWRYQNGVILYKNRIYLNATSSLLHVIMNEFHSGTHEGFCKTLYRIRANFYWS